MINSKKVSVGSFSKHDKERPSRVYVFNFVRGETEVGGKVSRIVREDYTSSKTYNRARRIELRCFPIANYFNKELRMDTPSWGFSGIEGMGLENEFLKWGFWNFNPNFHPWPLVSSQTFVLFTANTDQGRSQETVQKDKDYIYEADLFDWSPKVLLGFLFVWSIGYRIHRSLQPRGSFWWLVLACFFAHVGACLVGLYSLGAKL